MSKELILSGPWSRGINSSLPSQFLPDDQLQWTTNAITRAGVSTRPGFRYLVDPTGRDEVEPRGLNAFTSYFQNPSLIKVVGNQVRIAPINVLVDHWSLLGTIDDGIFPVYFANCVKGAANGVAIPIPYPIQILQTGVGPPYMWDGVNFRALLPTETPAGSVSKWFGSRLWTAQGSKLFASDLLDPISHTESDTLTGGGYLQFNGAITALATTSDNQNLIVFTADQTSAVRGSILDRTQWGLTPGFQTLIFDGIGCIAPRSIVNQYGMLWWMSQNGLIALDEALHSFRSSRLHFRDGNMARSRSNLSPDLSGIALGAFENFLVVSVPSGDTWNAHTWIMDQSPIDNITDASQPIWSSCWTGIRPFQWVTTTVGGTTRIFALSRDYKITGDDADWTSNAWECFTDNKYDLGSNADGTDVVAKRIDVSFETKALSPKEGGYSTYAYAEILTSGMARDQHWSAFYASVHSAYKQILDKNTVASVDSMQSGLSMASIVPSYLHQTRRLVCDSDEARLTDNDAQVEDIYTRNKDRAFTLLVKWSGEATVWAVILALDPRGDAPAVKSEEDETTDRFVSPGGGSSLGSSLNPLHTVAGGLSAPVTAHSSRSTEDFYSSMP